MVIKADEAVEFNNISATTATFLLKSGGYYAVFGSATFGGGSIDLQVQCADGSTFVSTGLKLTAAGLVSGVIPPGVYKFVITTATGVIVTVARCPVS